jgi:hypothetical protein
MEGNIPMNTVKGTQPTLADLVSHLERSHDLARLSDELAAAADANDVVLDGLIASSPYTVDEVREALTARWSTR